MEQEKRYRILPTTLLAPEHEQYRNQIGTYVNSYHDGMVVSIEFPDGCRLIFGGEEIEQVKEEVKHGQQPS